MKQLWLLASVFCLTTLLTAQTVRPQGPVVVERDTRPIAASEEDDDGVNDARFYIGAGAGGMRVHRTNAPKPGSGVRGIQPYVILRVGYDFADSPWSIEGHGMFGHAKTSAHWGNKNFHGGGVELLYHFDRYAQFDPFIAFGASRESANSAPFWQDGHRSHNFAQAGIGAFWHFSEKLSLRGDIRYHVALSDDYMSFTSADIGLTYFIDAHGETSADYLTPLATEPTTEIEPDALAYDEASEYKDKLIDVTPDGSIDEMKLELRLQYAKDTSIIEPVNYPALDELLRIMTLAFEANPSVYVTIDGHADRQHGSDHAYNQELSEARAKSVLNYLSTNGIPASRMKAAGHSFDQPKDPVNLDDGTPSNRRTEIVIRGVDEATRAKIRARQ
jgi:outer membrane protein OmpA-like peptidoglycan-associated protein